MEEQNEGWRGWRQQAQAEEANKLEMIMSSLAEMNKKIAHSEVTKAKETWRSKTSITGRIVLAFRDAPRCALSHLLNSSLNVDPKTIQGAREKNTQ